MSARPLSPHLGIYKPQLTSVLSILHRLTGVGLFVGTFLLVGWFVALALGDDVYLGIMALLNTVVGHGLLCAWVFAFYYHLCNGLRHLYWDMGCGFDLKTTYKTGWLVVGASSTLTLLTIGMVVWR